MADSWKAAHAVLMPSGALPVPAGTAGAVRYVHAAGICNLSTWALCEGSPKGILVALAILCRESCRCCLPS